jgi:hypothetical protein
MLLAAFLKESRQRPCLASCGATRLAGYGVRQGLTEQVMGQDCRMLVPPDGRHLLQASRCLARGSFETEATGLTAPQMLRGALGIKDKTCSNITK